MSDCGDADFSDQKKVSCNWILQRFWKFKNIYTESFWFEDLHTNYELEILKFRMLEFFGYQISFGDIFQHVLEKEICVSYLWSWGEKERTISTETSRVPYFSAQWVFCGLEGYLSCGSLETET